MTNFYLGQLVQYYQLSQTRINSTIDLNEDRDYV